MKNWYPEEWRFTLEVRAVGERDDPEECRIGLESGDFFTFTYGCPEGLCPKSMLQLFPLCEAARSGGDLRNLGGGGPTSFAFTCPDGVVQFALRAERI